MRILRVIASTSPTHGGPSEALVRSSIALTALGHEVVVVSLDPPGSTWLKELPFSVFALGPSTKIYEFSPHLIPWLRKRVSEFDVVIVHGFWNFTSIAAWWVLARKATPYFIFAHGMLDPWYRRAYPIKHYIKQLFWLCLEGRVARDAQAVLFTSEEECKLARTSYWGHRYSERVVAYGTRASAGDPDLQRQEFLKHASLPTNKKFLVFMSRIHPKKGCDLLLRAFARLSSHYSEWDIIMAGPDEIGWQKTLMALSGRLGVADRIHWVGMLTGDMKWGALLTAEAMVLPSHAENFGVVVAESLACGKPVLITDKVNIWREIEAGKAGFVAPDDEQGITLLLEKFFALPTEIHAEYCRAARTVFARYFSIEKAAADLVAAAQEIA